MMPVWGSEVITIGAKRNGFQFLAGQAGGGAAAPSFPVTPLVDLDSLDMSGVSNRYMPNRQAAAASASIVQLSAYRPQGTTSNVTATAGAATGPGGIANSAMQLNSGAATNGIFYLTSGSVAGAHVLSFKAKSASGAGSQTFRYGNYFATLNTVTVDESGWTTCSIALSSVATFCGIRDNSATFNILIDELQLTPGAVAATYSPTSHGFPTFASASTLTVTNGYFDTTGAAQVMSLPLPNFPAATTFTEGTEWAVFASDDTGVTVSKIFGQTGSTGGVAEIGLSQGKVYGAPAFPAANTRVIEAIASKGFHVLISTWKAGAQTFYIDGIPHTIATGTLSSFTRNVFGFMGDPPLSNGVTTGTWGNAGVKGKLTKAGVVATWITDAQAQQLYTKLVADHAANKVVNASLPAVGLIDFVVSDGDSIADAAGGFVDLSFTAMTGNVLGKSVAVPSTTLQNVSTGSMSRKADILKRVQAAVALGHNPIVSVLHGANATFTVSEARAYSDDLRAAGAKILYCTALHKVGDAPFNANIDTHNTNLIAAGSGLYDGIARFDGVLTETVGVDYTDVIHPNTAGHTKLKPIWQAAVEALRVH